MGAGLTGATWAGVLECDSSVDDRCVRARRSSAESLGVAGAALLDGVVVPVPPPLLLLPPPAPAAWWLSAGDEIGEEAPPGDDALLSASCALPSPVQKTTRPIVANRLKKTERNNTERAVITH